MADSNKVKGQSSAEVRGQTPEDGKKNKQKLKPKSPKAQGSSPSRLESQTKIKLETQKSDSQLTEKPSKDKGQKSPRGEGQKSPRDEGKKTTKGEGQKAGQGSQRPESNVTKPVEGQKLVMDVKQAIMDVKQAMKGDALKPEGQSSTEQVEGQQKSKAQLKAERRAIQESQRAAKTQQKAGGTVPAKKEKVPESKRVPDHVKADLPDTQKRVAKKLEKQQVQQRTSVHRKIKLFNHLQQYQREVSFTQLNRFTSSGIHPAIIKLGLQYAEGLIVGSNARCVALLAAFKKVIADYSTPPQKELGRDLDSKIKPYITFLIQCRPLSVSMGNAIKYLKWHITHTPRDMSDSKAKQLLCECIDTFIHERITVPADAISTYACRKIADGDVIMVYACSSLIRHVLLDAYKQGKKFRVIVVDGRPKLEGKEMLRRLVKEGIKCNYVLINAASYVMQEVTKVFLGSHALLANGCVMSRVGSSMIALIAKAYNVPTLVCCETYKFCERVQTDSFVFNELGDPNDLVKIANKSPILTDWKEHATLTLLNLVYDVTPPELITAVITEFDMIPCTSVPVVLRVKHAETSEP